MSTPSTEAGAVPVEQGTNDAPAQGTAAAQAAGSTNEPTFNQAQVNAMIAARIAETKRKAEERHKAELEATVGQTREAAETDVEKRVAARIKEIEADRALSAHRIALMTEYGLNDTQLARLSGKTAEELTADAEALFGTFKKKVSADDLAAAKKSLQEELKLTDKQLERLTGTTADELRADALELFGAPDPAAAEPATGVVRRPPVLLNGSTGGSGVLDLEQMTPEQIRKARSDGRLKFTR